MNHKPRSNRQPNGCSNKLANVLGANCTSNCTDNTPLEGIEDDATQRATAGTSAAAGGGNGGLCSGGRWAVADRKVPDGHGAVQLSAACRRCFLEWILEVGKEKKGFAQQIFWKLAAGKQQASPFKGFIEEAREEVDLVLV